MTSVSVAGAVDLAWDEFQAFLQGRPVPSFIVIIGLGDGVLIDALEQHGCDTHVLALEPDPACALRARSRDVVGRWIERGRLRYLADPDYTGADEAWRSFPTDGAEPVVLMGPRIMHAHGLARSAKVLQRILFGVEANAKARRRFAPRYLLNVVRNIPAIVRGADVRTLERRYQGMPAVIVGAGPSLDSVIAEIPALSGHAAIVSTDTALRPLLMAGISPELVVAVDPSEANLRHFQSLPACVETALVSELAIDRQATHLFDGRTFWFRAGDHQPWPWLRDQGVELGKLDIWGSVLTAAFEVACLAGCDPIVFVGADLAYTGGRPYARSTTYEFDWAWSAAAGEGLERAWSAQIGRGPTIACPDIAGRETTSTESLVSFRDWMVARVERCGRRVINASGAGILAGGRIEQLGLREAVSNGQTVPALDIPALDVAPRSIATQPSTAIAASLAGLRRRIADAPLATPLREWAAFSGDSFDSQSLDAALSDAIRAFAEKQPPAASELDWSILAQADAAQHATSRLSDGVLRFAQRLSGQPLSADQAGPPAMERARLIAVASEWLTRLTARIVEGEDPVPVGDFVPHPGLPVSVQYQWSESMRWALFAFEGLLGAIDAAPSYREDPFRADPARSRDEAQALAADCGSQQAKDICSALAVQLAACAAGGTHPIIPALGPGDNKTIWVRELTRTKQGQDDQMRSPVLHVADAPTVVRPRVLTNEGFRRSRVAYAIPGAVVCVAPYARESVRVSASGKADVHHRWPKPIVAELPFGDRGAVAWGHETAASSDVRGYVMHRDRPDVDPVVQLLPIRPAIGEWFNDRLYWGCFPTAHADWVGVASWAPGEEIVNELPGLVLMDISTAGDSMELAPCEISPMRGYSRRSLPQGWRWTPGTEPVGIEPGLHGLVSSRARHGRWTARAHPQADVLSFESDDGTSVSTHCHFPLRLAWLDHALLVSTAEHDVLLFEDVIGVLNR